MNFHDDEEKLIDGHLQYQNVNNLYETLDVPQNASLKEIRESYFRLKNTYNTNNQALYSLLDEEERSSYLNDIAEAYRVLSNVESRSHYDRSLLGAYNVNKDQEYSRHKPNQLPQEASSDHRVGGARGSSFMDEKQSFTSGEQAQVNVFGEVKQQPKNIGLFSNGFGGGVKRTLSPNGLSVDLQEKIKEIIDQNEKGDGLVLMKIREALGVSREELQDHTKISLGYVFYLEENRFDLLPQPIYVKGFLNSYLKFLSVDNYESIVRAYLERFKAWLKEKS